MAVDPTSFFYDVGSTYQLGNGLSDLPTAARDSIRAQIGQYAEYVTERGQTQPMPAKTCTYCKSSGQGVNCLNCGAALPERNS